MQSPLSAPVSQCQQGGNSRIDGWSNAHERAVAACLEGIAPGGRCRASVLFREAVDCLDIAMGTGYRSCIGALLGEAGI